VLDDTRACPGLEYCCFAGEGLCTSSEAALLVTGAQPARPFSPSPIGPPRVPLFAPAGRGAAVAWHPNGRGNGANVRAPLSANPQFFQKLEKRFAVPFIDRWVYDPASAMFAPRWRRNAGEYLNAYVLSLGRQ